MRHGIITGGMSAVSSLGLPRLAAPWLRGFGAVLMLHRVRPHHGPDGFSPNGKLEITPAFLDSALAHLRRLGYRPLSLDDALAELRDGRARRQTPFVVVTFDDGYRDNLHHALPILERHGVPATIYLSTGLINRTARLWWIELEEVVRRTSAFDLQVGTTRVRFGARNAVEKSAAFSALHRALQALGDDDLLAVVEEMGRRAGVDAGRLLSDACMDWAEVHTMAASPLVTIGAHTITHRRLSILDEAQMTAEMVESKRELEERLRRPVRHMAFPYGDAGAARQREYAAAIRIYDSAVTSLYGLVTDPASAAAGILPRVSLDGRRQDLGCLDVLLSGLPRLLKPRRAHEAGLVAGTPASLRHPAEPAAAASPIEPVTWRP